MLLLTSTSDVLRVITGAAVTIDVHASFMDLSAGVTTPGRQNTAITTATTTTVVAAPGGSTQRNVKFLSIRNKDAGPCDITVEHFDGSTAVELKKVALPADGELHFVEGVGFLML
jgi:hypothetical protein